VSSFVDEVKSGDRRRGLLALRDKLATAIDAGPEDKDLAALSIRLERVLEQLDQLGFQANEEHDDDLAAKRRAKLSAASGL